VKKLSTLPLREIPSEKRYFANSEGELFSTAPFWRNKKRSQPETRRKKLKQQINGSGDRVVGVNNRRVRRVGQLVCEAFNGRCPAGCTLYYIDNDRTNVRADNVIWISKSSLDVRKVLLLTSEQVRGVPGYPGYFCTTSGQVISTKRRKAFFLKSTVNEAGYYRVALRRRHMYTHRVVASTFHGPPPPGCDQVRHLNGDKSDNRPENLRWGSHFENNFIDKQNHGSLKLTFGAVQEIRQGISEGMPQAVLAECFGIGRSMISAIKTEKTWRQERENEIKSTYTREIMCPL